MEEVLVKVNALMVAAAVNMASVDSPMITVPEFSHVTMILVTPTPTR